MKKILLTIAALLAVVFSLQAQENGNTMLIISYNGDIYRKAVKDVKEVLFVDVKSEDYVDLGLPSGTLWAICNVGASSPYDAGSLFAWGETSPKQDYSLDNYKWYNTATGKYTKYISDVDNKTELELDDDAASVNCGKVWRMPTKAQFDELLAGCSWEWKFTGILFTSNFNDKTIFFPAVRYPHDGLPPGLSVKFGHYWSRSNDNDRFAYYLNFDSGDVKTDFDHRYNEMSVRAVLVP